MQDRKKDIRPKNNKGIPHGYWEIYRNSNTLWNKCFYVNEIEYGYEEILRYKLYHAK